MVEVFKTNVQEKKEATELIKVLLQYFPGTRINLDLHDCDKILRVEGDSIEAHQVIKLVKSKGFYCCMLE